MVVKQILLTVLMMVYCAKLGVSLQCHQCSGSLDDCNSVTAEKMVCLPGQDRCSSLMITKDGETNVVLGCASENDCVSAENTCVEAEKTARTTCKATCCQSEECNKPPAKVNNLRCFECQSAESMEHCIQNSHAVTCKSSEETQCAKFTSELVMGDKKVMVYRKGCREEDACTKKDKDFFMQQCGSDDTCENLCCKNDLCNAGSFFTISVAILLASVLMAIFFM